MNTTQRNARLDPLPLQLRINIACSAQRFFSPTEYGDMCRFIGKARKQGVIEPFTVRDFLVYLSKTNTLAEAYRYQQRVRELLNQLVATRVLTEAGSTGDPLLGRTYYCLREFTVHEQSGNLWLAEALGPEFLQRIYSSLLVHVTGKTKDGDAHAGTGILLTSTIILTCAHVLEEIALDPTIVVQGALRQVVRATSHSKIVSELSR